MGTPVDLLRGEAVLLRRGVTLYVSQNVRHDLNPDLSLDVNPCLGRLPTLVFLHGGLGNRYNWRSQYEFFHGRGQSVLAYDLAGHGQSTPYSRYSLGRHCRDLTRLLRGFHIGAPILCCHSYGVPLGLEWAQQHPVSGLVLIAGGTHDLDPWWEIPLMKFLTWGGRHLYRIPGVQQLTNAVSTSHRHDTIQRFFQESPVPTVAHSYRALEIFWRYNFFHRNAHPEQLDTPVLVISGGQDSMFTEAMGAALANYFPQGQHLHLPDAGHLLMAEYPELVNQAIADWMDQPLGL